MVRTLSIKNKCYVVVITTLEATGIETPVQIHIDVTHLDDNDRWKIQKHAMRLFDHPLKVHPPHHHYKVKKPWYKFW